MHTIGYLINADGTSLNLYTTDEVKAACATILPGQTVEVITEGDDTEIVAEG